MWLSEWLSGRRNRFLDEYRRVCGDAIRAVDLASATFEESDLPTYEEFLTTLFADATQSLVESPRQSSPGTLTDRRLLCEIRAQGDFREGRVCYLDDESGDPVFIVGDLHGDWSAFRAAVDRTTLMNGGRGRVVFLGDYIDRGLKGLQVLVGVLLLKVVFPDRVFLLGGNHEQWKLGESGHPEVTVSGDNLFLDFWREHLSPETLLRMKAVLDAMPSVILMGGQGILVHGGVPRPRRSDGAYEHIRSLADLSRPEVADEMTWSDPEDKDDVYILGDTRFSFARKQFSEFMDVIGARYMVRGHEPVREGYRFMFDRRLLTIFSTGGRENEDAYPGYSFVNPCIAEFNGLRVSVREVFGKGDPIDEHDYSTAAGDAQVEGSC